MGIFDNGTGNLGIGDAISNLTAQAQAAFGITSGAFGNSSPASPLPWQDNGATPSKSSFFHYIDIQPDRWNQLFPYRLMVIDTSKGNVLVGTTNFLKAVEQVTGVQQGTPTLIFTPLTTNWIFSLPITPQQLNITDQFAINTSATLRGILEEHNGVKFKMISASGTMGVWTYRESVTKPPQSPSIVQSIFGGTLTAVSGLINQVATTVNTFTNNSPHPKPTTIGPTDPGSSYGPTSSGYYQALFLQQFLEQYAEAKKNPANSGWRLVFDIPKQNQSYIVTPMAFTWSQSVNKPMEITYNLQFKAWRRIDLQEVPRKPSPAQNYQITPGILQRILNGITEARLTCSSAIAAIGAVRSDVDNVFNVLNQTALFVKDLSGVATTASDLPSSLKKDFSSAIQQFVSSNSTTLLAAVTTTAGVAAVASIVSATQARNGLTQTNASNGQLGNSTANAQQTNNAATIFNNPNANVDLFDQVPTNQLKLNTAQQNKLNSILANSSLSIQQLKNNGDTILTLANQLADYFGAGSTSFNKLFGLTPPTSRVQPMTINEFLILDTLYEFVNGINFLTATTQVTDLTLQSSFNFIAGLANQSNIAFNTPNSKISVPVPFGLDLEQIAGRYLGDPNRWLEIATLNQLEEPYIDQSGFQLPLLSNAIGRQAIVSSNQNLFLGQTVIFKSSTQTQSARKLTNITTIPNNGGFLLTVDGDPNLGNFTTADGAYIQAYLPNTVNSQQYIFIPSDLPPPTYPGQQDIIPPPIAQNDKLTGLSGVDILLDESNDVVLDSYGDFLISYGMNNLIQALRILFSTTLNTFLIHPEYGLGVQPGMSVADLNIRQLYNQINQQILQDPRFSNVTSLQIQATPPTLTISVGVALPNMQGTLPLSFQLAA